MKRLPVMLFAAGLGSRMRHLTAHQPKPLIRVAGKALIDHALNKVDAAQTGPVVINLHYLGEQLRTHLAHRPDILFSPEPETLLDTGGGLRQAQGMLGAETVVTMNTDAVWTGENPVSQLQAAWQPDKMDCLLLLLPTALTSGHGEKSDFALRPDGRLHRGGGDETHVYLGAQIVKTTALAAINAKVFSLNVLWNQMIAAGRAYGVVHRGGWCDVGHPEGIAIAEAMLQGKTA